MSNLSDIGFDVADKEDFYTLIDNLYKKATPVKTSKGTYFLYSDTSGAEVWLQISKQNEMIGANPHFNGKSRRKVSLTASLERPESVLDGAFHAWADPEEGGDIDSGIYPFVFDVPNHKKYLGIELPQIVEIQLAAFAQELNYYESETAFEQEQEGEMKWAPQSFIPSGLFSAAESAATSTPEAMGILTGTIRQVEKKNNQFTGQAFYWMLVDTLGGEIDILADLRYFDDTLPRVGGVINGQFWLSGTLVSKPKMAEKPKIGFLKKFFGSK